MVKKYKLESGREIELTYLSYEDWAWLQDESYSHYVQKGTAISFVVAGKALLKSKAIKDQEELRTWTTEEIVEALNKITEHNSLTDEQKKS